MLLGEYRELDSELDREASESFEVRGESGYSMETFLDEELREEREDMFYVVWIMILLDG